MTKLELVKKVCGRTGMNKEDVLSVIESTIMEIKITMSEGKNLYLRGFGSFIVKERAETIGRNITKNTTVVIPAHKVPAFRPCKAFKEEIKKNSKSK